MTAKKQTARRQFAYQRVAKLLQERIARRELHDGDLLPTEMALTREFSVTRSTIREALRDLESHGLVGRRRGSKRMAVTRPTAAAIVARASSALALHDVTVGEVCDAVLLLCPACAELAARRRNAESLQRIDAAAHSFAASGNAAAAVIAVGAYFQAVDAATGNRALVLSVRPLLPLLESSLRLLIDRVPQARTRIAQAQRRIRDAIAAGDAATASEWMAKHARDFRRGFELAKIATATRVEVPTAISGDIS